MPPAVVNGKELDLSGLAALVLVIPVGLILILVLAVTIRWFCFKNKSEMLAIVKALHACMFHGK